MDGLLDFLHEHFATGWFEDVRHHFGQGISDNDIAQSVHEASVFFGQDDPAGVHESLTTGIMTNMPYTESDDILIFNRQQLADVGITDKEGFDLVMTHEGAHRMLQDMKDITNFNSHQEELCCDYMAGVRAGLNGMDQGKMEASLAGEHASVSHPDGISRIHSIENGVTFAHEFQAACHRPPTFSECLEHFQKTEECSEACVIGESVNTTFHGYTQGEINKHISKAKLDIAEAESDIRHHTYMIKSKTAMNEPCSTDQMHLHDAERRLSDARHELNKWYHEHPTVSNFVDDDCVSDRRIQDAINHADDVIFRAEALASANDIELGIDTSQVSSFCDNASNMDDGDETTLKGLFVNSRAANSHSAQKYQEKAKIERHEAELDQKKGDFAAMRNHLRLAESYQKMADQYAKDAMASTK